MTNQPHEPVLALPHLKAMAALEQLHEQPRLYLPRPKGEEMRTELSETDPQQAEIAGLRKILATANLTEAATRAINKELSRLERLPPQTPNYQWSHAYIEQLLGLPRHTAPSQGFYLGNARCGSCGPEKGEGAHH